MGGFAGFFDTDGNVKEDRYFWTALVRRMLRRIKHRGTGAEKVHISDNFAAASIGAERNEQFYSFTRNNRRLHILFDGKLSNRSALQAILADGGQPCAGDTDAEAILRAYLLFEERCPEKLEGAWAFIIEDCEKQSLFLCRDRFGAKPLFCSFAGGRLAFSSEIKGLFEYPGIRPALDERGVYELLGFGGVRSPGCGIFKGIFELPPAHYAVYGLNGFRQRNYWRLPAKPFTQYTDLCDDKAPEPASPFCSDLLCEKATGFTSQNSLRVLTETLIARDLPVFGRPSLDLYGTFVQTSPFEPPSIGRGGLFRPALPFDRNPLLSVINTGNISAKAVLTYVGEQDTESLLLCPVLRGEAARNRLYRQQKFRIIHRELPYVLELLDRYAAYTGSVSHIPFVDHQRLEYHFNLPMDPAECTDPAPAPPCTLPDEAAEKLAAVLSDTAQPLHLLFDRQKLSVLLQNRSPANTDLLFWVLQIALWLNHYKIRIEL